MLKAAATVLLIAACGPSTPGPETTPEPERPVTTVEVIREEPPPEEGPAEAPREAMLVKGIATPLREGEAPSVRITEPRKNAVVKRGPVKVKLAVKGWPTLASGPYVAVVVDDLPPIRVDDPSQAIELTADRLGGAELAEGSHLLRAFAVRGSGESVREANAFAATTFHLGSRTDGWGFEPAGPFLTLHLPSGAYRGDTSAAILLDFHLTRPAAGQKVKVSVGEAITGEISEWVPHHLQDLPDGPNTLVLELVGADGAPVAGAFRRVSRTFTVERGAVASE